MKKIGKKPVIIASAGTVLLAVILICVLLSRGKIPDRYVCRVPEYSGINGYGSIKYDSCLNVSALVRDLTDGAKNSTDTDISGCIEYRTSGGTDGRLKNGDKIRVEIHVDTEKAAKLLSLKNVPYSHRKITFTVSGLENGTAVNIFDAIERVVYDNTVPVGENNPYIEYKKYYEKNYGTDATVSVSGTAPDQRVKYTSLSGQNFVFDIDYGFSVDKTSKDKIVLSVENQADSYAGGKIVLYPVSQSFTPASVSFVTGYDFSKDAMTELTQRVRDRIASEPYFAEYSTPKAAVVTKTEDGKCTASRLVFFVGYSGSYSVYYFDNFKKFDDGTLYGFSSLRPKAEDSGRLYGSIEDYVKKNGFTDYKEIRS